MINSTATTDGTDQNSLTMLSSREKEVTFGFYLVTFILGLIGNVLVLIIVIKKRSKRTVNDMFIMNLAVSDLTLIFFIPLHMYDLFKTLPATIFICNFVKPMMTVTFFVSIFTLTCMAVYRCKVILNPFRPEMKELSALVLVGIIWASSLVFTLPLMIITKPLDTECKEDWPSHSHRRAYTASLFVLQYLLPLLVIAVAYIRIGLDLSRVRISRFSMMQKITQKEANYKARSRENKQVVKTLATIVVMFALCLLPGQVAWMLLDFGNDQQKIAHLCIKFGVITSVFHSCVNPLIYGTLTRQFRRGYVKYLSYLLCCCESNSMVQKMRLLRVESTRLDSKRRLTMSFFRRESAPNHSNTLELSKHKKTSGCLDFKDFVDRQLLREHKDKNRNIRRTVESLL